MPSIAKVLKTDVMADLDLRGIAQLLKGYGRGKDTMLAHITPEEARMLKERGGRGSINPETGLPEFDDTLLDIEAPYTGGAAPAVAPTTVETPVAPLAVDVTAQQGAGGTQGANAPLPQQTPGANYSGVYNPAMEQQAMTPTGAEAAYTASQYPGLYAGGAVPSAGEATSFVPGMQPANIPEAQVPGLPAAGAAAAPADKSWYEQLTPQDKLKMALGLGMGGLGLVQGRQASKQAAQAKQQLQDLAAPYQQQGQQLIAQAQRGELTPANQQALQAAAAQLQQGIANRGGVGVTQAANALANLQANMLQQQYSYGLQVAGIGDQYAKQAISVGLQQDREIASLMQGLATAFGGFAGSRPNAPAASV